MLSVLTFDGRSGAMCARCDPGVNGERPCVAERPMSVISMSIVTPVRMPTPGSDVKIGPAGYSARVALSARPGRGGEPGRSTELREQSWSDRAVHLRADRASVADSPTTASTAGG